MSLWDSPSGEYFTSYEERMGLVRWRIEKLVAIFGVPLPFLVPLGVELGLIGRGQMTFMAFIMITAIAVIGLNIILGYAGEIVLAQGAFMAIGAWTATRLINAGTGLIPALLAGGVVTGLVSLVVGLPSFRVKGFYIAITTLALQFIAEWFFANPELSILHGGTRHSLPRSIGLLGDFVVITRGDASFYYLALVSLTLVALLSWNISRSSVGRSLKAVRDNDLAAQVLGVNVYLNKLLAFSLGGFVIGVAGGLYAFYLRHIEVDFFTIQMTIDHYVMLIFGGLGYVWGAIIGTGLVTLLLDYLRSGIITFAQTFGLSPSATAIRPIIFGFIIIIVLIVEPKGLMAVLGKVKEYLRNWPYAY